MIFNIRGNKIEITDAIRSYIESKIGKLDKYFENPEENTANVVARIIGKQQVIEITIYSKGIILRAEESTSDLYAAIDLVLEKLEKQIIKNKTRMNKKANKNSVVGINVDSIGEEDLVEDGLVIKRKKVEMKPMSEEEAILQMNFLGHDFFVFKNVDTNSTDVLYRRKDGNFGIIETK